jgi:DNA (cytosine-5)-methyltransferase 1
MPERPRLLDLFCGAGGIAEGYHRAGFEIVGVDIEPQPHYPFEFHQADALTFPLDGFDCYHASPPCQFASDLAFRTGGEYPNLVAPTQKLLRATCLPYIIENVSRRAGLCDPVMLCGSMFGLGANGRQLRRHRLFECNFPVMAPPCQHRGQPIGVYGTGGGGQMTRGYKGTPEEYRGAMGIDWATRAEIAQAIPPAYGEHIGQYLMAEIRARAAA